MCPAGRLADDVVRPGGSSEIIDAAKPRLQGSTHRGSGQARDQVSQSAIVNRREYERGAFRRRTFGESPSLWASDHRFAILFPDGGSR